MIRKIWLDGFRNFSNTLVDLSTDRTVVIFGKNNQGKTNLLESLFFMINGKSPRESISEHLIQFDAKEALMGASIEVAGQPKKLYVRLQRDGQKVISLDETVYRSFMPLRKQVNLAYLSADIIRFLQDSPSNRRGFLDEFLTGYYPAYSGLLKKYKGCVSQKNQLLKQGGNATSLSVWNQSLLALSGDLVRYRVEGCRLLSETLAKMVRALDLPFGETLEITYDVPKYESEADTFVAGYQSFLEMRLADGMSKEMHAGYCLYGPHRDDFSVTVDGRSLFHFFSRGVNRTLAILLTLAGLSLRYDQSGAFPILLLDDTFAELDSDMKGRLIPYIQSQTQLFYATVLEEDKQVLGTARILEIDSGAVVDGGR